MFWTCNWYMLGFPWAIPHFLSSKGFYVSDANQLWHFFFHLEPNYFKTIDQPGELGGLASLNHWVVVVIWVYDCYYLFRFFSWLSSSWIFPSKNLVSFLHYFSSFDFLTLAIFKNPFIMTLTVSDAAHNHH